MNNTVKKEVQAVEYFDCEQNSEAWDQCRMGVITASSFSKILAKGNGITRTKYLRTLAGERMADTPEENYSNEYMNRGHELEQQAVEAYEAKTGNKAELVGFAKYLGFGASPDRLVGEDGLVEIKTANLGIQIERLERLIKIRKENKPEHLALPPEHRAQVQGQLFITNRQWCDFVSYHSLKLPIFVIRVPRDKEYIADLHEALKIAEIEINTIINRVNGAW